MNNIYTKEQLEYLTRAVWYVLDDMRYEGISCSLFAKAQLRSAYEPFADDEEKAYEDWMSFEEAQSILDADYNNV